MKKDIHPQVYNEVTISCACGNSFMGQSTNKEIKVDICNKCHPLYTGQSRLIDTEGRVDKFANKMKKFEELKAKQPVKATKVKEKSSEPQENLTFKEYLEKAKEE